MQRKNLQKRRTLEGVKELYQTGIIDEHLEPLVFLDDTGHGYKVEKTTGCSSLIIARTEQGNCQKILNRKHSHNLFLSNDRI